MSPSNLPDEDLVLRARGGDAEAVAALFERHAARLARLGRRRLVGALRRRDGESDVVQDTLRAAFRDLERFESAGPGSFARWLDAILRHKTEDLLRRGLAARRTVRREAGGVSSVQPVDPGPTPSSVAGRNERAALLRGAIARMEGDDRLILSLVHEQGMTFVEAGRLMGRSADAARMLYGRVVARLAKSVRRRGES